MPDSVLNRLLDKVVDGSLTHEDREELVGFLEAMEKDSSQSEPDRMAAILMRASLEARAVHVRP